jgi:hypothetical protein
MRGFGGLVPSFGTRQAEEVPTELKQSISTSTSTAETAWRPRLVGSIPRIFPIDCAGKQITSNEKVWQLLFEAGRLSGIE